MTSCRFSPVACLVLAAVSSAGRAQSGPLPVSVDPEVARTIDTLAVMPTTVPLRRLEMQTTRPSGTDLPASTSYEALGKNVWNLTSEQALKNGQIHGRTLSLCGLLDLAGRSQSELHFENTVGIPIGPIVLPMGSKVTKKLTMGTRITSLTLDEGARNMCAPSPGADFAFSMRAELETLHEASSRSDPKKIDYGLAMKCHAEQIKPAAELGKAWSGSYLPVTCTSTGLKSGKSTTTRWAFLVDSGFYLPLEADSEAGHVSHSYLALELAPGT